MAVRHWACVQMDCAEPGASSVRLQAEKARAELQQLRCSTEREVQAAREEALAVHAASGAPSSRVWGGVSFWRADAAFGGDPVQQVLTRRCSDASKHGSRVRLAVTA
jgi:hypothetical protein